MSLNTTKDALSISKAYDQHKKNFSLNPGRELLDIIQDTIDDGFQEAKPSLNNFDITSPAGSLFIPMSSGVDMANLIGKACADYWSKAITPKIPVSCRSIISVVNDASKIEIPITKNLKTLSGKTEILKPLYYNFIDAIYKEVKTIKWTIMEADGSGCSVTLTGAVS